MTSHSYGIQRTDSIRYRVSSIVSAGISLIDDRHIYRPTIRKYLKRSSRSIDIFWLRERRRHVFYFIWCIHIKKFAKLFQRMILKIRSEKSLTFFRLQMLRDDTEVFFEIFILKEIVDLEFIELEKTDRYFTLDI